jgi:hypothetical protein
MRKVKKPEDVRTYTMIIFITFTLKLIGLLLTKRMIGRAMAQAVSRQPLTAAARVNPVGFVVQKVALGQVFLRVLRFSRVNIIPPWVPHFRK